MAFAMLLIRAAGPHRSMSILEVSDLTTRFHTPEGIVYAVNGVSFNLEEKETLAVVGESGCGKSVSMLSLLKLIPVPPGEIVRGKAIFYSTDLLNLSESEMEKIRGSEISMIFQDPMTSLNPVLSVGRQITETLRVHQGMNQKQANNRAAELLDLVGISDPINRLEEYPHQFSGGMRQRVMIAMALSCNPSILIADEPTTALDVTIQAQIVELVAEIRQQVGMAVIWITHDLGVVAGIADRVLVMYAGFIVEEASVYELYEKPVHPYTNALLAALPRVDRRRNARLKSIRGAPPSLLVEPRGCPFSNRCDFSLEQCQEENPLLTPYSPTGHKVACWNPLINGSPR
jgi:oligopeptide transport system ATP-binding protein